MYNEVKTMDTIISYCGIICTGCPLFIATQKDDNDERKKVVEELAKEYKMNNIKPEDINCDGCLSKSGRIFKHCAICEIRNCGIEKEIENCAYCEDYACDKLSQFHEKNQKPKKTLDDIRENIN